ncbi:MAG: thiamine phosphate synthase [Actinomycetota bacterium]
MGSLAGDDRRDRLNAARLFVVTDARERRGDLRDFLEAILDAGVDMVELREKDADARDLLKWGEVYTEACAMHRALFIVNDRPDVARALDADGVHLGQDDLPPSAARDILGPDAIIGLSCHSAEQQDLAAPEADYVTAGPVYGTPTKPGRAATGLDLVRHAAEKVTRPWFAIGGIDPETLHEVLEAGASRIVVVRAVCDAADPAEAVKELLTGLPGD